MAEIIAQANQASAWGIKWDNEAPVSSRKSVSVSMSFRQVATTYRFFCFLPLALIVMCFTIAGEWGSKRVFCG